MIFIFKGFPDLLSVLSERGSYGENYGVRRSVFHFNVGSQSSWVGKTVLLRNDVAYLKPGGSKCPSLLDGSPSID